LKSDISRSSKSSPSYREDTLWKGGEATIHTPQPRTVSVLTPSSQNFSWIPKLESSFREHGLSNVDGKRFPPLDQQRKIFTDDVLMGVENMLVAFSTKEKEASGLDITPQWQEACKQAVMESKQGMCLACDLISVVGQKPL
jgi:hypothetical protein